jgi:hypothetical protein
MVYVCLLLMIQGWANLSKSENLLIRFFTDHLFVERFGTPNIILAVISDSRVPHIGRHVLVHENRIDEFESKGISSVLPQEKVQCLLDKLTFGFG